MKKLIKTFQELNESLVRDDSLEQLKRVMNKDEFDYSNNILKNGNIQTMEEFEKNGRVDYKNESSSTLEDDIDFGCVMVNFNLENKDEILKHIKQEDLYYTDSKEDYKPHMTILYGLHDNVTKNDVIECISEVNRPVIIDIEKIDIFTNDEYQTLHYKLNVTNDIKIANSLLSNLDNSNEFPDYNPHITLAYLKKDVDANEYMNNLKDINPIFKYKDIVYSSKEGNVFI